MDMIVNATNPDHGAIKAHGDGAEIAVHCAPVGRLTKKGVPFFG
jgi:hypothetical protein